MDAIRLVLLVQPTPRHSYVKTSSFLDEHCFSSLGIIIILFFTPFLLPSLPPVDSIKLFRGLTGVVFNRIGNQDFSSNQNQKT